MKEEAVRKAYEAERARQAEAARLARERTDTYSRVVMWFVFVICLGMALLAMYVGFPVALQALADYREGWLPTGIFAFQFILLGIGPVLLALGLLVLVWIFRKSI